MQRAAAGLAAAILRRLDRAYGSRVLLVVGSGNNGGDALWAGVRLARRGVVVRAWRTGAGVHEAGWAAFLAAGGRELGPTQVLGELHRWDFVVDAVAGIGSHPGLVEPVASFARACRAARGAGGGRRPAVRAGRGAALRGGGALHGHADRHFRRLQAVPADRTGALGVRRGRTCRHRAGAHPAGGAPVVPGPRSPLPGRCRRRSPTSTPAALSGWTPGRWTTRVLRCSVPPARSTPGPAWCAIWGRSRWSPGCLTRFPTWWPPRAGCSRW